MSASSPLQRGHRLVQREQRRGTGRVDGHGRPFQAEGKGDSAGSRVEGGAGDGIQAGGRFVGLARAEAYGAVIVVADADIDPRPAALQSVGVDQRILKCGPAGLQQYALLRVQQLCLHRRDPEELGVEQVDVVNESGVVTGGELLRRFGIELPDAADAGTGNALGDRVPARLQESPEGR